MASYLNFGCALTTTRIATGLRIRFPNNGVKQPHTGVVPNTFLQSGVRQVAPNASGILKDAGVHCYNENVQLHNGRGSSDSTGKVQPAITVDDRPLAFPKRLPTSFVSTPLDGQS